MAISIDSIETLQTYLSGVMGRADHHAGAVEGVSLALLGAVVWRSTGEISVKQNKGNTANIIWFFVNENRFALAYNHATEKIELRERTQSGNALAEFDNSTTYQEVINVFRGL
tara:strand:+ start:415 stop:753 length:339 start_codon:yes stop_codon:yes gene_type:complete